MKYFGVRFHFTWDQVKKEIELEYIKAKNQIIDIFTKPFNFEVFYKLGIYLESFMEED